MPTLTTPSLPAGARRSARRSGQLRKALLVEVAPSVMESPNATTVPVAVVASTSTSVTRAVRRASFCSGNCAASVWSPGTPDMYCSKEWPVRVAVPGR